MTQSRSRSVRIALVQMHCSEDVADNLARGLARIDETHASVAASLARDGCAYYYRPSACWAQLRDEAPAQPDPTALRTECAATEARLQLEPLHVETILAVPASAASYRRPQIDVGFFRIRALAL